MDQASTVDMDHQRYSTDLHDHSDKLLIEYKGNNPGFDDTHRQFDTVTENSHGELRLPCNTLTSMTSELQSVHSQSSCQPSVQSETLDPPVTFVKSESNQKVCVPSTDKLQLVIAEEEHNIANEDKQFFSELMESTNGFQYSSVDQSEAILPVFPDHRSTSQESETGDESGSDTTITL